MSRINNSSVVSHQYKDDMNLSIRIALHQKYSTNKYGYINWIFDQFDFTEGCSILELGCGNGFMWDNRIQSLPVGSSLVLSDISEGMLETVREKFKNYSNVTTEVIDIQNISYPDNSFDIVIANSMLYHIPNIQKAISEVYRVLKPGGKFYATTTGVNGMLEYLHGKLKEFNPKINAFSEHLPFNLQNGKDILTDKFFNVEIYEYVDSLEITETSDLIDWILSATRMSGIEEKYELEGLNEFFEKCKDSNGVIKIPKQAGIFVAIK